MRAGQLRHRVSIRTPVETQDATSGEIIRSWSTLSSSVWADIRPMKAYERWLGSQMQSRADMTIKIRYLPGIVAKGLVVKGATEYEIEGIENTDERNTELQLSCYKVVM